ncbi:MAG: hypothetical protein NDI69_15955 [Bacteriovoracaceae bacterium]|nr:hypothetical protein [Bacteriovoracaceae bacterium]
MRKLSRLEATKEVRRVLNRHGVDLSYCQYSVAGMEVRLTGWLCKLNTSNFNGSQIESMIQEFMRLLPGYSIVGSLDNWSFSSDHINFIGDERDDSPNSGGGGEEDQERYVIDYDSEAS